MADDIDMTPSSDAAKGVDTSPPPDQQQPAPQAGTEQQAQQDISQLQKENTAVSEWLNKQSELQASQAKFYQDQMAPLMGEIQKMRSEPDMAPPAMPATQPISEANKGSLSQNIFELLKFGALMGLAFGTAGRRGGAVGKAAIAGAIGGYVEGKNHTRDLGLKVWEKNNELMEKQFTERQQMWKDIMADKRLKLQESMDLLGKTAEMWKNDRMMDAQSRQDFMSAHKIIQDNDRLIKDYKSQIPKIRQAIWAALGKGKDADDYKARLISKHGRQPASEEELDKWTQEYTPAQHMDDLAKEAGHKELLKKQADEQAKKEAADKAKSDKQHMNHPGAAPGNRLGLNLD